MIKEDNDNQRLEIDKVFLNDHKTQAKTNKLYSGNVGLLRFIPRV